MPCGDKITEFHINLVQVRAQNAPMAKITIAVNDKPDSNGGLFAVETNGATKHQSSLSVAGTLALKSGWKASVKVFTDDKDWFAKTQSGFSCHILKTFHGCTDKQQAQKLDQVFAVDGTTIQNISNSSESTEANDLSPPDAATANSGIETHADAATNLHACGLGAVIFMLFVT